jgi:hypothetical protein
MHAPLQPYVVSCDPLHLLRAAAASCCCSLISDDLRRGFPKRAEHTFSVAIGLAVMAGVAVMVMMEVRAGCCCWAESASSCGLLHLNLLLLSLRTCVWVSIWCGGHGGHGDDGGMCL